MPRSTSLLLSALCVFTALNAHAKSSPPTIVLVHGAFADGSSWNGVIPLLQAKGHEVVAVQNPLSSLADDVALTEKVIAEQDGPVVLVGHSWGGVVITQAGANEKVKSLVYVTALAPAVGEAAGALGKDFPPLPWQSEVKPLADGMMYLPEHTVATSLAQDLPKSVARVLTATQGATPAKIFAEPVSVAAWSTKPSFYVVASKDRMIQPAQQTAMAKKINAKVVNVSAGHMVMMSQPRRVADVILDAAK